MRWFGLKSGGRSFTFAVRREYETKFHGRPLRRRFLLVFALLPSLRAGRILEKCHSEACFLPGKPISCIDSIEEGFLASLGMTGKGECALALTPASLGMPAKVRSPSEANAQGQTSGGTAELRGQVVDENGQPVARVELVFAPDSGNSVTVFSDAAGRFEIGKLSRLKMVDVGVQTGILPDQRAGSGSFAGKQRDFGDGES